MKDQHLESDIPAASPPRFGGTERDDGLVDRLLKLADSGPEIPPGGADRVRAAIRPAWRREVRARSRRRWLRGAGSVAAAAAVVLAVALVYTSHRSEPVATVSVARLTVVLGTIEAIPQTGEPMLLGDGDIGVALDSGSRLKTGTSSRASFELAGGESLRMDADSELTLESDTLVALVEGAVYVDTEGIAGEGIEVWTSFGVAREIGTQFEVRRSDGSLTVRVREGRVALSRDADEIEIPFGTALTITPDGSYTADSIASFSPAWDWVQMIAPVFDMEGRTAAELLDWVSRETGLWISFGSTDVEEAARNAVLHGSLDGVSPADAPDLVLPGCGLESVRGSGTLTIEFPSSEAWEPFQPRDATPTS